MFIKYIKNAKIFFYLKLMYYLCGINKNIY